MQSHTRGNHESWLEKLEKEEYISTEIRVPKLDNQIRSRSFNVLRDPFLAPEITGVWEKSLFTVDEHPIYRCTFRTKNPNYPDSKVVEYWARKELVHKWYEKWWRNLLKTHNEWRAAWTILYLCDNAAPEAMLPLPETDAANYFVQMKGLNHFLDIARQEPYVFWESCWDNKNQKLQIPEDENRQLKIAENYQLPIEFAWGLRLYLHAPHYSQRADGSWWTKNYSSVHDRIPKYDPKPNEDLPLEIRHSGGFHSGPIDKDYAAKQEKIAKFYNIPKVDVRWQNPQKPKSPITPPTYNNPLIPYDALNNRIRNGLGDIWTVFLPIDTNEQIDNFFTHTSQETYFGKPFGETPVPTERLRYTKEKGLHQID